MSSELLPCPYCGHEGNTVSGEPGMYEILCDGCDHACFAYFHSKTMAIEAWNRRTVPAPAIPDSVAATIRQALRVIRHAAELNDKISGTNHVAETDAALTWLDSHPQAQDSTTAQE